MVKNTRIKRKKSSGFHLNPNPKPMTRAQCQLAQHTGMRTKDPLKVSLAKAPWEDEDDSTTDSTLNSTKGKL